MGYACVTKDEHLPARENLKLIAYKTSECSDDPVHSHSPTEAFTVKYTA